MNKWDIIKIKNKKSKYDFRLISKKNDYSNINFFKHSYFRILVSLSSYFTKGIISKLNRYYKINFQKNVPAIFDFSLTNISKKQKKYMTIDNNLSKIIFHNNGTDYNIELLSLTDTKIFSSMFIFEEIPNMNKFIKENNQFYKNISTKKNNLYLTTGWVDLNKNYIIIDLVKFDKKYKKTNLVRCKILDKSLLKATSKLNAKINSYSIFILQFNSNNSFVIKYILPVTFDEYLSYVYDLMLPYKYDFKDINYNNSIESITYKNNDVERIAFAIDPDGSKDRDDAISSFYLNNNKIVDNLEDATHIKLVVHISDTLPYITPKNSNYYYHYSKYKCNTDYLDKFNLPMMDRLLSEDSLSLDGEKNNAITINLTYKIIDKNKFVIRPFPENVKIHRSKNLKIIGTTYKKFSESFALKKEKNFSNNSFNKRYIINCNNNLIRDYNEFIYEGSSMYPNKVKQNIANNLKQLYIFFVNSLNHTGKDTLIKIPSNLTREKHFGKSNIYLDFSPVDMWSHSLIEYTALESNIYFSYLMYLISKNKIKLERNTYNFDYKIIHKLIESVGNKNQKHLLNNIINEKKVNLSKSGIYRNLYTPGKEVDFYINEEIQNMLIKIYKRKKIMTEIIKIFLTYFNYKSIEGSTKIINFLKLILALRQVLLLLKSNTNLEVSKKMISKEIKMKAKYDFFPFAHLDICSLFYTHATSPMRRFVDINVHNFIFSNKFRKYIYSNLDLDGINLSVNTGKYIHQLVNNNRLIEFIDINSGKKNLIMNSVILDKKKNMIGFYEIVNFYNFNETFNLGDKKSKVLLKLDNYNLPILKKINTTDKVFNIFFHMLRKESENIRPKCQKFLEKLFNTKKVNKIC